MSLKIAIVGAGAAGLMAAARILELDQGHEVFLIERNKILGKKVIISGGGRCNVTTGLQDLKEVLKNYPRGSRFLRTALYAFPPQAMWEWMEAHGVPLKCEADLRVFPKSNNGMHVVRAFERFFQGSKVQILFQTAVKSIQKEAGGFVLELGDQDLQVDRVILCTGGQAYRHTGSQGDGYSFAESMGHQVTPLGPSLNALVLKEQWIRELAGVSFKQVGLRFVGQEKYVFSGPILFTHRGVTGPAVFALSALASYEVFDSNKPAQVFVDFFPEQTREELAQQLQLEFKKHPKKQFQSILNFWMPRSFGEAFLQHLGVDGTKQPNELSKKELNRTLESLKHLGFSVVGRAAGDEFVTAGGVELSEVDSKSMESKLCPGLYFAGEILNYDGFTGGFNLQAAWATGRLAGESAATIAT